MDIRISSRNTPNLKEETALIEGSSFDLSPGISKTTWLLKFLGESPSPPHPLALVAMKSEASPLVARVVAQSSWIVPADVPKMIAERTAGVDGSFFSDLVGHRYLAFLDRRTSAGSAWFARFKHASGGGFTN